MEKNHNLIRKITNLCGIVFIMLGMIPIPVLSQIGSVYAAEQLEDGAAAVDLPAFVSYTELLGSTSVKLDAVVEMVVDLPEISGRHGDWISLAILGPVLAEEGDDVVPTEEPAAEEPPAEEPPAEEGGEAPAEEPPAEEEPVCEGECASEEGEPLAEDEPVCEGEECAPEAEELPVEEEPVCEGDECAPNPVVEEPAVETPEESLVEVVAALAEADVVLVNENNELVSLASEEAAEILIAPDPWFWNGDDKHCFVPLGGSCITTGTEPCTTCTLTSTPIQAAINYAIGDLVLDNPTIFIEADTYAEIVSIDYQVTLIGVQDETTVTKTVTDPDDGNVFINTVNLSVNISGWQNIFVTIVNVMNDTAEIQDGIDIVAAGGTVHVEPGEYIGELVIDKPMILDGDVGSEIGFGPGGDAPILIQNETDWQTNAAIELSADNVTIQGFIFKGFQYGVDISSHDIVNINNNMFLYYPTSGAGIYTYTGTPLNIEEKLNIEFPPEENGYGMFYNNECSNPLYDCTKIEDESDGGIYWITADVIVIKTGAANGHEFFFTPDNSSNCDPTVELYCVTWNTNGWDSGSWRAM
jgi:hypothetical protein